MGCELYLNSYFLKVGDKGQNKKAFTSFSPGFNRRAHYPEMGSHRPTNPCAWNERTMRKENKTSSERLPTL